MKKWNLAVVIATVVVVVLTGVLTYKLIADSPSVTATIETSEYTPVLFEDNAEVLPEEGYKFLDLSIKVGPEFPMKSATASYGSYELTKLSVEGNTVRVVFEVPLDLMVYSEDLTVESSAKDKEVMLNILEVSTNGN